MLNKAVELVFGFFIFVLLSADSDTHLSWDVSDTSAPEESVKAGVYTYILPSIKTILDIKLKLNYQMAAETSIGAGSYLSEHFSLCEFSDLSDSSGCSLLELDFVESFVEINGVISGNWLDLLLLSFLHTRHFLSFSNILIINIKIIHSYIYNY